MTPVLLILVAALALALIMAAAWAVIIRTGKSGWADTFWTASIGIVGATAALIPLDAAPITARSMIVAALVAFWSLRLATHIARRTIAGGDDPRYAQLRDEWGDRYRGQLFIFLQIQAAAALVLVIAIIAASRNAAALGFGDALGILIALIAIAGEAISDAQLKAFSANNGKVCDVGLWSLSRHPNYFFEWLYWVSYVVIGVSFSVPYPWGWVPLAAPLMMYWLLVHVSGIPLLEAHMLRTRGEAFADYQRRVSAFWPLPAKAD